MYNQVDDIDGAFRKYETDETSGEVLDRALDWRKGTDKDPVHTAKRVGYHPPFKGRIDLDRLECADGEVLYRLTIDGQALLYDDEDEFGGWMTYHELLCFIEGYKRLNDFEDFLDADDE